MIMIDHCYLKINIFSKARNKVIAKVFHHMGLIEEWGTGLGRILRQAESYHLKTPDFIEMDTAFCINLYRVNDSKTREKVLLLIQENPVITIAELAEKLKLTVKGVEWQLSKLKNEGAIIRIGEDKGGKWEVK